MASAAAIMLLIYRNVMYFIALMDPHIYMEPGLAIFLIRSTKSVGGYKPYPYLASVMCCILWIMYGFLHPDGTLIKTMNIVGLALELFYVAQFYTYGDNNMRFKMSVVLVCELVLIGHITTFTFTVFHTHGMRLTFLGGICAAIGIMTLMYGSPPTVLYDRVWIAESEELFSVLTSLLGFINAISWIIHAFFTFDLIIIIFNGMAAILYAIQLLLWTWYSVIYPRYCAATATATATATAIQTIP